MAGVTLSIDINEYCDVYFIFFINEHFRVVKGVE